MNFRVPVKGKTYCACDVFLADDAFGFSGDRAIFGARIVSLKLP